MEKSLVFWSTIKQIKNARVQSVSWTTYMFRLREISMCFILDPIATLDRDLIFGKKGWLLLTFIDKVLSFMQFTPNTFRMWRFNREYCNCSVINLECRNRFIRKWSYIRKQKIVARVNVLIKRDRWMDLSLSIRKVSIF